MRGDLERRVGTFAATTLGGSGEYGTSLHHWTVTTDGVLERHVTVSSSGRRLRPRDARRLAMLLLKAADRAEREQASLDREGWR